MRNTRVQKRIDEIEQQLKAWDKEMLDILFSYDPPFSFFDHPTTENGVPIVECSTWINFTNKDYKRLDKLRTQKAYAVLEVEELREKIGYYTNPTI